MAASEADGLWIGTDLPSYRMKDAKTFIGTHTIGVINQYDHRRAAVPLGNAVTYNMGWVPRLQLANTCCKRLWDGRLHL